MKHLILTSFLCFFLSAASAQQTYLSVTPNPASQVFTEDLSNLDLELKIYTEVKNLTDDTLRLKWTRHPMGMPDGWLTQVCDPNACWLPTVDTNYDPDKVIEPVVLPPDSSFTLILYVLPGGVAGSGAVDLDFSLIVSPEAVIETIMFQAEVRDLTTSFFRPRPQLIRLFPNPAADYFELSQSSGIDQLVVYNLLGRKVRQFSVNHSQQHYSLQGLPDGMYLVSMVSLRKGVLKTLRLSKRSLRP